MGQSMRKECGMKKAVFLILVTMGVLAGGPLVAQGIGEPRIDVREMQHDVGTVAQGTRVEHVFEIRNGGTAELVIQRVVPS